MSQLTRTTISIPRLRRRPMALAAVATALLAFVPSAQASGAGEGRSPDAILAGAEARQAQDRGTPELRSPDAILAGATVQQSPTGQRDSRTPDAILAGRPLPAAPSPAGDSSGDDWAYPAIGGLAVVAITGLALTRRRRRHSPKPASAPVGS